MKQNRKDNENIELLRMVITDRERAEMFIRKWTASRKKPRKVAIQVLQSLGIDFNKLPKQ